MEGCQERGCRGRGDTPTIFQCVSDLCSPPLPPLRSPLSLSKSSVLPPPVLPSPFTSPLSHLPSPPPPHPPGRSPSCSSYPLCA